MPTEPRPIEFHQLCAIARTVLQGDPSMGDAEWKAQTKDVVRRQGYAYPAPEKLTAAMTQVENALRKTLGPRPVDLPPGPPEKVKPTQDDPPWRQARRSSQFGWGSMASLVRNLQGFDASKLSSGKSVAARAERTEPKETLAIDEYAALDVFYGALNRHPDIDRMALLQTFAEIAIVRPEGWDTAEIRAKADDHRLFAERCFVCRCDRPLTWHHIIQVQFGGSNTPRNRIAICAACHIAIHPWMPAPDEIPGRTGFVHISGGKFPVEA